MESKRLHKKLQRGRTSARRASEVAAAFNASSYYNSVGYDFEKIDRSPNKFPPLATGGEKELRKMCDIQYSFLDERGKRSREDGVILCRKVPVMPGTEGAPFEVYDLLLDPPGGQLCRCCSKVKQRPVRHGSVKCPYAEAYQPKKSLGLENDFEQDAGMKANLILCPGPDPARIQGEQNNKAYMANLKKSQGTHPCKFVNPSTRNLCQSGHYYNSESKANKHMAEIHSIDLWDNRMSPACRQIRFSLQAQQVQERLQNC